MKTLILPLIATLAIVPEFAFANNENNWKTLEKQVIHTNLQRHLNEALELVQAELFRLDTSNINALEEVAQKESATRVVKVQDEKAHNLGE